MKKTLQGGKLQFSKPPRRFFEIFVDGYGFSGWNKV